MRHPLRSPSTALPAGGSADIPGILNETRGPGGGLVSTAGALDTTGVPTVGGTALLGGLDHLELARAPAVTAQVGARPG
ncbi:hypothetical protein OU787_28990 [Kitasatospora sp. YST-16]|uniref:hypothetical protein n=1 Tax=Kitasatospora sp. YST-16 TaxID=2998080 RepID=UPI0022852BC4|nr:hypothetical protein [Kitasatospora sp. YST-16]WAL75208.1 hypothetical protein OU787_28990 [Kitasatospora sp. YST-16]WNW41265.1 hypothetical protein RKE32_28915 [Streptomyces sp. Li-HN-5-13]